MIIMFDATARFDDEFLTGIRAEDDEEETEEDWEEGEPDAEDLDDEEEVAEADADAY